MLNRTNWNITAVITALIIIISVVISYYYLAPKVNLLEGLHQLYRFEFTPTKVKNEKIVLIGITEDTINKLGRRPFKNNLDDYHFKRSEYAKVISKILEGKPKVIGIDIFFDGIKDLEDDLKLTKELNESDTQIVLAVYPDEADNLITNKIRLLPSYQFEFKNVSVGNVVGLKSNTRLITKSLLIPVVDEKKREYLPFPVVVTNKYLNAEYKLKFLTGNTFPVVVTNKYLNEEYKLISLPGNIFVAAIDDIEISLPLGHMPINYIGGIEAFNSISFEDVSKTNPSVFKDKIVLIGGYTDPFKDIFLTPVSPKTPGVVIHANAIDTILNKQFITEVRIVYHIIIAFFVCALIAVAVFLIRPLWGLVTGIGILLVYKIVIDFIFAKYRFYFLFTPVFFSVLFSYLGVFAAVKFRNYRVRE